MVALTPFSWLAHLTTDDTGFGTACVAFALLGALNAVLVMRLCVQLGVQAWPAAAGGLFYAVWFGSIESEFMTKLEPLGNTLVLCALHAAVRAQRTGLRRWTVLAGVALGLLGSVKIWWAVPILAIAVWHVRRMPSRRRSAVHLVSGFAAAVAVLDGPFFLAAPRAMLTSVVADQLGRTRTATIFRRFADLTTATHLAPQPSYVVLGLLVVLAAVLLAAVVRRALRVPQCRPAVLLLAAQLIVVLAAPSWFPYYSDFLAVPAAVVVAAAAVPGTNPASRRRFGVGWVAVVTAALLTCGILSSAKNAVQPFRGSAALTRAAAPVRCVLSDAPMGLIELNSLSRGLAHGCPDWIDVTGRTYGVDAPTSPHIPRSRNARWQRDLTAYLRSGQAVILVRSGGTGVSAATMRAVSRDGVLARAGGRVLYRVAH
jgi:hypothetical protein